METRAKQIYQYPPPAVEPGYFSNSKNRSPRSPRDSPNNLYLPQIHESPSPRVSRQNSYNRKNDYYSNQRVYEEPSNLRESFNNRKPLSNLDSNILAGHYPVFMYPKSQGVPKTPSFNGGIQSPGYNSPGYISPGYSTPQYTPGYNGGLQHQFSFGSGDYNRVSRHESMNSNKELIDELKVKLMINKAAKQPQNAPDSPYKECNNLEDILQTHDRITQ